MSSSLNTLANLLLYVHVSLVLRSPDMNMWVDHLGVSHQCWTEGKNQLLQPAGNILPNAMQEAVGSIFLLLLLLQGCITGSWSSWYPSRLSRHSSAKLLSTGSPSSTLWCMAVVLPQEFTPSWILWDSCWLNSPACPYPMNISTVLWFINHSSQFCIFQNVSACVLCLITQVIMKIINSVGPRSILGHTTSDWLLTGLYVANHSPLSSTAQPVCNHQHLSSSYWLHFFIGML